MSKSAATNEPAIPATEGAPPPTLGRWWWVPFASVVLALLVLVIVPMAVELQVAALRQQIDASENARVALNDLEAGFAAELLLLNAGAAPVDTPSFARGSTIDQDRAQLRIEVARLGPDAQRLYADLLARLGVWNGARHPLTSGAVQEGLNVLNSAEQLDAYLTGYSERHRNDARSLERLFVTTPTVLGPIAIVAMVIVLWSSGRIRRLARVADEERGAVIRASEARAALLRGVTHDVKNPLGAAAGYAQLLEEGIVGPLADKQLDMVRRIHRLVGAAVQTVTDLLELARADGELHIQYAGVDLAVVVQEVVDDHKGMAQERRIALECATPSTAVVTDPLRVRQILGNLLSNAIKYTPAGGRVAISLVADGTPDRPNVGVEVRDTGPGIPTELQGRIFEEFFRVRRSEQAILDGNGLGLAISRRIARLIGGDVTVDSPPTGGSVFTLWIPSASTKRAARFG